MHKCIWHTATDKKCIQLCLQTDNAEDVPEDLSASKHMSHIDAYFPQKLCVTVIVCCTYNLNVRQAETEVNAQCKRVHEGTNFRLSCSVGTVLKTSSAAVQVYCKECLAPAPAKAMYFWRLSMLLVQVIDMHRQQSAAPDTSVHQARVPILLQLLLSTRMTHSTASVACRQPPFQVNLCPHLDRLRQRCTQVVIAPSSYE